MDALPIPDAHNGKAKLKLLERKVAAWPKRNRTESGWIYVYSFASEEAAGRNYYKVGSTKAEVGPTKRVAQHHKRAVLRYSLFLERGYQWAERVIHLYLWYVRMYRYMIEDKGEPSFYSIWARDLKLPPIEHGNHDKPPATHKQIEWFCMELEPLITLIKAVGRVAAL